MNLINLLWWRFHQCLGTFTIMLVEGSSETALFRHLSGYVVGVRTFEKKFMRFIFFSKSLKFHLYFKNEVKNWENFFCYLDNSIWIGIVKLSLLRTGYFSLAGNVLKSRTKIFHVNRRDFFRLRRLGSDQWIR